MKTNRVFTIYVLAVCTLVMLPVVAAIRTTPKAPPVWDNAEPAVAPQGLLKIAASVAEEPTDAAPQLSPLSEEGSGLVRVTTPLYEVTIDRHHHLATVIKYTVRGKDLATPGSERTGSFWAGKYKASVLEESDYAGSGYQIGHLRAWRLSAGNPQWEWCNWMGAVVPMNARLNQGVFSRWEAYIAGQVREYGQADVTIVVVPGNAITPKSDQPWSKLIACDEIHYVPDLFLCMVEWPTGPDCGGFNLWAFPNVDPVDKKLDDFKGMDRCQRCYFYHAQGITVSRQQPTDGGVINER